MRKVSLAPVALVVGLAAGAGAASGCDHKPSEEDCEDATNKFIELVAEREGVEPKGESEEKMYEEFKKACIADGTTKELACIEAATEFDDLKRCMK